jgi:hypothetical protein
MSEARYIDLYFVPDDASIDVPMLGLLWKCASAGAAFEAFRCAVQDDEIRSTMGTGVYMLGDIQRTGIVVVHHLPKTPDTVWFRILGKGKVQQKAIDEIEALPANSPYRDKTLELFVKLKVNL